MKKQNAFTMIELIFVIVILGILTALSLPRIERDLKQEAAGNILSAIRYTQHLALLDNKHKFDNPKWQQRYWRLYFGTCTDGKFYTIGSDDNNESAANARVDFTESAIDPANGKHIWAKDGGACEGTHSVTDISPNIFIEKKYGVDTIAGGCGNVKFVAFDHLGRPYGSGFSTSNTPDNSGYMGNDCNFTFSSSSGDFSGTFSIIIKKETGYAFIEGQPDS
jgi:prepilin-type N-terminal cleavage/methylation domain-containing protein